MNQKTKDAILALAHGALDENDNVLSLREQIQHYLYGEMSSGDMFIVTPDSSSLGIPRTENSILAMSQSTFKKVEIEHDISPRFLENLPEYITNHVLAMDSLTRPNSLLLVLDELDKNENDILVVIHLHVEKDCFVIDQIPTIYGKEDLCYLLENTYAAGLDFYPNEKTADWLSHTRLSLPEGLTNWLLNDCTTSKDTERLPEKKTALDYLSNEIKNSYKGIGASANSEIFYEPFVVEALSTNKAIFIEPIRSGLAGVMEVVLNHTPEEDIVINVVYDNYKRETIQDDWEFVKKALKQEYPLEPWVLNGLDSPWTDLDGTHTSLLNVYQYLTFGELANHLETVVGYDCAGCEEAFIDYHNRRGVIIENLVELLKMGTSIQTDYGLISYDHLGHSSILNVIRNGADCKEILSQEDLFVIYSLIAKKGSKPTEYECNIIWNAMKDFHMDTQAFDWLYDEIDHRLDLRTKLPASSADEHEVLAKGQIDTENINR